MNEKEKRAFIIDSDIVYIDFVYDDEFEIWVGDYPCFEEEPRKTPNGRLWKNVTFTECPYAPKDFLDCGSCSYLVKQDPSDMIGVCYNNALRQLADDASKEENL